ncbi:hypothetical protein CON23_21195 [Bacillus thuringiensis]|uniref:hypothetical protein n=1 Tax=Bacillus thuringiensis TaxID=1428 RepID=UPI000BED8202|nr:hypothetical protein [Bacillus thuringiensis]PEF10234.1 hypothetical protein CON23_21195 [Bacillus thuringiensis]
MQQDSIYIEIPQPKERAKPKYRVKKPRRKLKQPKIKEKLLRYWFEYGLEKIETEPKPKPKPQQQPSKVGKRPIVIEYNGGRDLDNWNHETNQKL